jgi:deoxyribonuclease (pyrimidine dimer)
MMRINVINPKYLTDNHLIAEYRETKMSTYYYKRSSQSKNGINPNKISPIYTLNKGHAYMWFDKYGYISKRFDAVVQEMKNRGFQTNFDKLNFDGIPSEAFGDYNPTQNDIRINLDRVLLRISDKPQWYKFQGETNSDWNVWYETLFQEGKLLGLY